MAAPNWRAFLPIVRGGGGRGVLSGVFVSFRLVWYRVGSFGMSVVSFFLSVSVFSLSSARFSLSVFPVSLCYFQSFESFVG